MTQEEKELLLKDLCARLLYGVKVYVNQDELQKSDNYWNNWNFNEEPQVIDTVSVYGVTFECMDISDGIIGFEYIKPYLFPMSSMTEEQEIELEIICSSDKFDFKNRRFIDFCGYGTIDFDVVLNVIAWLNANHFDYKELIEKGLAIDCTDLNIY